MRKEYRTAIIGGVLSGVVNAIILFIIRDYFSWTYLILSVILSPIALLAVLKMVNKEKD